MGWLWLFVACAGAAASAAATSAAALRPSMPFDMTPGGCTASSYTFSGPFASLKTDVVIRFVHQTPAYFWAHQFGLVGNNYGYIGIQGDGSLFNDTQVGRATIFSIWNSAAAVPLDARAVCGTFGGEGTGLSCRFAYPWRDGVRYRYHVFRVDGANATDVWWAASVEDTSTGIVSLIGKIQVQPTQGALLGPTVFFLEYYGALASCLALPYTRIEIATPQVEGANVTSIGGAPYGRCAFAAAAHCNTSTCVLTAGL